MARGFTDGESPPSRIPREYLDCVEVRAYHIELFLAVETATFSGRVRIPVHIAGAAREVFYLHAADLEISSATVNDVPASIERANTSLIRLKMAVESAVAGEQVIEVHFRGLISTWRPEGISMLSDEVRSSPYFPTRDELTERREGGGGGGSDSDDGPVGNNTAPDSNRHVGQPGGFPRRGVLGTHLEPTHARDLFPCVDLPSCKAVFHFTLHGVPAHLQAISNSPILREEQGLRVGAANVEGTANHSPEGAMKVPPKKSVSFQPTPVMPTYIFGFWVGDFQYLTTQAIAPRDGRDATLMCCKALSTEMTMPSAPAVEKKNEENGGGEYVEEEGGNEGPPGVEINVHVLRSVSLEGARFSLDFTRRAFELFSGLFTVKFPLPKLDMLGLPMMHGLGMENFGAITMLQNYMVVTGETTFVRRRRIARLICHEVCHQWYGDIVTPQSFDELWLKEGLARFFEYIAVDALDPSYRVWTNFMSEVFFQAMLADAQDGSHPVVQHHNGDISSILQSFDTITYCKGASVLRMLCHCVGPSRFLEGTRRFVVDHQYACATQEDLWRAVQSVCDEDGMALNIRDLMRPWLTRAMFPVLRVHMSGANTLSITQEPFSFQELQRTRVRDSNVTSSTAAAEASPIPTESSTGSSEVNASSVNEQRTGQSPVVRRNDQSRDRAPETSSGNTAEVSSDVSTDVVDTPPVVASGATEAYKASSPSRLRSIRHGVDGDGAPPWVVPLRIRVAKGSRSSSDVDGVGSGGVEIARGPGVRPGEEMYSFLMTESSTSVVLSGLSQAPNNVEPSYTEAQAAADDVTPANESRPGGSNDAENGREAEGGEKVGGRPYLVMNDGHSGFFTVQYECERSWSLALAALEQGMLSECEATGIVHDLILGLHERVIFERYMNIAGSGRGNYGERSDVTHLLFRLEEVVRLLGRDRSHPAWCTGQLFIWEMHMMHASNTVGDLRLMIRRRRDPTFAKFRPASAHNGVSSVSTSFDTAKHECSNRSNPQQPSGAAPSSVTDANVAGEGSQPAAPEMINAAAAEEENTRIVTEAGTLFSRIMDDLKLACTEAEEHVQWHNERVASGVEQAAEPLQSLQVILDRLQRFRAHLSFSETILRPRDGSSGSDTSGAGDGSGKKVKIGATGSATSPPR